MQMTATPYAYIAAGLQQIAYVVRDIQAGQRFFIEHIGIPRFYLMEDVRFANQTYRGQECDSSLHIAMAYAGEIQIELVESLSGQNIYQEFLEGKGEGLHHLGFLIDDYERAVRDFTANGYPVIQSGRVRRDRGTRFAYFDTEAAIGSLMEIIAPDEAGWQLFDRIKRGDF